MKFNTSDKITSKSYEDISYDLNNFLYCIDTIVDATNSDKKNMIDKGMKGHLALGNIIRKKSNLSIQKNGLTVDEEIIITNLDILAKYVGGDEMMNTFEKTIKDQDISKWTEVFLTDYFINN